MSDTIFKEIDLSKLPGARICSANLGNVQFHGIEITYPRTQPTIFLVKPLANVLGVTRGFLLSKFFNHHDYESIFQRFGITEETEVLKDDTGARAISTRLLWCLIRWFNREVFIEKASKVFLNIDIYNEAVHQSIVNDNIMSLFGVNITYDKRDGLVYFQNLNREFSNSYKLKTRELTKYKRAGTLCSLIQTFKERATFASIIDEHRVLAHSPALFIHPNLAIYFLDYLYTIEFWISIIDNSSNQNEEIENKNIEDNQNEEIENKNIEEIRPTVNLNETKTVDIDDDFAYGNLAEFSLRFHKRTSYIHAASTAEAIYGDTEKMKHFSDRFMSNRDTKDFINELESEIRANTEFDKTNEIESQLNEHPSWFKLESSGNRNELRGYFLHPELWLQFVFWIDKKTGLRLNQLLIIQLQRLVIKEQTLDAAISIEHQKLKNEIKELKEENTKLKHQLRVIEIAETGSIVIEGSINGFHTRTSIINEPARTNRIVIENIRKPKVILDSIQDLLSSHFKRIRKNLWEGELNEETRNIIEMSIAAYKKKEAETAFKFNENEFASRLARYESSHNQFDKGFLYESYSSRQLEAVLYKDVTDEWLAHFGLNRNDPGIDLVDIENKRIYQCKHYSVLKNSNSIQRSVSSAMKVKAIDSDYKSILIVPSKCYVHKPVRSLFDEIVRVDFE